MLELSWRGRDAVVVGDQTRKFIADNDEVVIKGLCMSMFVRIRSIANSARSFSVQIVCSGFDWGLQGHL
jgi:hypothetical protein